jgi:hypothetical protein
LRELLGDQHPDTQRVCRSLVTLYEAWEQPRLADVYRDGLGLASGVDGPTPTQ